MPSHKPIFISFHWQKKDKNVILLKKIATDKEDVQCRCKAVISSSMHVSSHSLTSPSQACMHVSAFRYIAFSHWPFWAVGQLPEAGRVSDELVEDCDNLSKLWPVAPSLLPAVQHELVQHHRTIHWSGETVALIYCFDNLLGDGGGY